MTHPRTFAGPRSHRRARAGTEYGDGVLIADIHHVSLNVADTRRSLGFYCDLLGMAMLDRPDFAFGGAWLDAGNGRQIHLIETDRVPADLGQHVAFRVADIAQVIEALRVAGHEVADPSRVGGTPILQTFVSDPDGNRVEFTQVPA